MGIIDFHQHYNGNLDNASRFVEQWRAGGVDKGVVFGLNHEDGSHVSMDATAALAERFPDFFIPFAYLNLGYEDCLSAVGEARARGFKGLKFIYTAKPYDDDEYFPIYEAAAEAGMVCLFHTGIIVGSGKPGGEHGTAFQKKWRISSDYMRPMRLDRIARAFPEMPIVGAHVGAESWYEEATSMLEWLNNIYFDMSIAQFHYVRKNAPAGADARAIKPRIQELYDCGQLDLRRILFGSDACVGSSKVNPSWPLGVLEYELAGLGATDEEKEAVRWRTAARILGLA